MSHTLIPIVSVDPHPHNPRLTIRDDVVESIGAQLRRRGYEMRHAIHARPVGDRYQVVSGHHRLVAAQRAGLEEIWAWVEEMDDERAFMELVLANSQGELTPLEIGMHALEAVPLEKGGRGKTGGLSAYAKAIGKSRSYVNENRLAAEVLVANPSVDRHLYLDKAQHLAAIHAAPEGAWGALAKVVVDNGWSAKETKQHVAELRAFTVPERWDSWLPLASIVEKYLDPDVKRFTPARVASLVSQADAVLAWLEDQGIPRDEFLDWVVAEKPLDARELLAWKQRAEAKLEEGLSAAPDAWRLGRWEGHIDSLKDGSVALLLTDPPYGIGYQSGFRGTKHKTISGDESTECIARCIRALAPKLRDNAHAFIFCRWGESEVAIMEACAEAGLSVKGSLVWVKNNTSMGDLEGAFAPKHERIVHAVKGSPKLFRRDPDVLCFDRVPTERHPTEKPTDLLECLITATTVEGELVADPFGGVASTIVAAISTGRRAWGCEVDEDYCKHGKERVEGAIRSK